MLWHDPSWECNYQNCYELIKFVRKIIEIVKQESKLLKNGPNCKYLKIDWNCQKMIEIV